MTKLQRARQLLMKQLDDIEQGKADMAEINSVVDISDALTKTYNTELRAKELEIRAEEASVVIEGLDVFEDM